MKDFLKNLNPLQREAVIHNTGPLLIVAGAGTGKTSVITSRIANLVCNMHVKSGEILALTFTEKATEEMIERVDLLMPLSYEEIWIKTFHSFCDCVLRERGHEIGIDPGYRLLTQIDQWLLLKKNLFRIPLDYYRPSGNPSRFLFTLLNYFSRLKDEYILPEELKNYAELLPEQDDVQKEERKKFLELACAYDFYQNLLTAENVLDFGDLVFQTLRLFEMRSSVLAEYQDRFRHILVDEFQDTNYAQTRLVLLLAKKYGNITVVGDDDQSIYRWRGASLSNILEFQKQFPSAKSIVLTENYRSNQEILDSAYGLIQKNNPNRLEYREQISKKLIAKAALLQDVKKTNGNANVSIWHFDHFPDEVDHVVSDIATSATHGIFWREMAILARSNQQLKSFTGELKARKIPYQVRTPEGMFSLEEIKDLLSVARLVSNPHDDIAMYRYLQLTVFSLPMEDIVNLYSQSHRENLSLYEFLSKESGPSQTTIPGLEQSFLQAFQLLKELIAFSKNQSPLKIFLEFLHRSQYLQKLIDDESGETVEKVQNLHRFGRFVDHFEKTEKSSTLYDFLEYTELLEEAHGEKFENSPAADYDAVQLLTVHSAKGLEFSRVYIVNCVQHRFPSMEKEDPLEIPEALIKETSSEDHHLEEERRLFYVACTRAKDTLILSYSDTYEGKKKWKPSVFISEIAESSEGGQNGGFVKQENFPSERQKMESFFRDSVSPLLQGARLHRSVRRFSYSQFDTFLTCPLKYRYRYLFPIPVPPSHAANFGSSVHNALNLFYKSLKRGEPVNFELLSGLYEQEWIPYGYENKAHENVQKKKGLTMLQAFYEKNSVPEFAVPYGLEKAFSIKVGEISVSGRIDRIDRLEDGSYEVIDYKTGSSKRDANLSKDLQLSLYAWACRDIFHIPVSKLSLYFLNDQEKISTTRSNEQIDGVKADILKLALELQNSEYQPTPGFHCQYCDYRLVCPAV